MLRAIAIRSSMLWVMILVLAVGAPWALSGEAETSPTADWDGDGKVTVTEQRRYDWLADQIALDDRGVAARREDAQEGRGEDLNLPADASYLPPEEWRTLAEGAGTNRRYEAATAANELIVLGDRKGPLPVEIWATADGFERHVFTVEIRVQLNKKDDPKDDRYLIDVYDPAREHGNSERPEGGVEAIREDFNRFDLEGRTVERTGKSPPESAFGEQYQLVIGQDIHDGSAAVVLSVGPFAMQAFALTVTRTPQGELRGRLWRSRVFQAEQRTLRDEVDTAKLKVRADIAARRSKD